MRMEKLKVGTTRVIVVFLDSQGVRSAYSGAVYLPPGGIDGEN